MRFEDVLAEFGRVSGLGELVLDDSGSCSLLFDGEHELNFVGGREDDAVFLYGIAGGAGTLRDAESCRSLLTASCLGAETGGAAFAQYGNSLILWKRHDRFVDYSALEKAVNDFLAQLIHWKEKLAAPPDSGPARSAPIDVPPEGIRI
ncbi:MAG: type III secretion system chaperone [Zoogloeaceae bacterium]|jgi:hypothetical protein|nr:type III secretion system chaperone [Zoogloeaceae bacterium]